MEKLKPKFIVGGGGLGITTGENYRLSPKDKKTPEHVPGYIINDTFDGKGLYDFVNKVIEGKNTKAEYSSSKDEYWSNGYTAKVVEKDGKKMFKIFFRLTDDYEPYYVNLKEFKGLVEVYINEKAKFDSDPIQYKLDMVKNGAMVMLSGKRWGGGSDVQQKNGLVIVASRRERKVLEKYRDAYQAGDLKTQERIENELRKRRDEAIKKEKQRQEERNQEEIEERKQKESVIRTIPNLGPPSIVQYTDTKQIYLDVYIDLRESERPEVYLTLVQSILRALGFQKRKKLLADLEELIRGGKVEISYSTSPEKIYANKEAFPATVESETLHGERFILCAGGLPTQFCYIIPKVLRKLLAYWVAEDERFLADPKAYIEKLQKDNKGSVHITDVDAFEEWVKKAKFDQDPEKYKEGLKKSGG